MDTDYSAFSEEEIESLRNGVLGQEVAVGEIQSRLRQLWEGDETRTRASLINFAIYNEKLGGLLENSRMLSAITREQACRALLIMSIPGERRDVRAWITAHCHLANGHKTVCSEQIAFLLQGGRASTLRNIVFANLDSDLPLVFWWQGEFSENFEDRLYSVIDRLIFDSSSWSDPKRGFGVLLAARAERGTRFYMSDLAWARSHKLRAGLATRFEMPSARAQLKKLDTLRIRHGSAGAMPAAFVTAWAAKALDAKPRGVREGWILQRERAPDIAVVHEEGESPYLEQIELSGGDASFRVTCAGTRIEAVTEAPGCSNRQLRPGAPQDDADLLRSMLERAGDKSLYESLVPVVREMI